MCKRIKEEERDGERKVERERQNWWWNWSNCVKTVEVWGGVELVAEMAWGGCAGGGRVRCAKKF